MTVVASKFERRSLDLYETEEWATRALLRHFPVSGKKVWEPAAGNHKIVRELAKHGAGVWASDIETYDHSHCTTMDFLTGYCSPMERWDAIITNPPYGKGNRDAVRWAELSLQRCGGHVALLLTAKFDFGKTRQHLFRDCPRFMAKIALVDRIQWFTGATTGTEDHAWYVWGPGAGAPYTPRMFWEGRE